jgi:ribosomal protein L18E
MAARQGKALASYRRRLKQQGVARLEVRVRKDDAPLVRNVARALADPRRETQAP